MKFAKKISLVVGVIVLAAAVPGTLALAGSGSSVADCTRAQLGIRSNGTQGALGTIYGAWVLANLSSSKCVLHGYPSVGLYGPKDERRHGPWPPGPRTRTVRGGAPCGPCLLRKCEHRICMSSLFAEDVFLALREVLAAEPAPAAGISPHAPA